MMRFLELAKQALGAKSDQSDRTPRGDDLSSLSALSSQASASRSRGDGCGLHAVSSDDVTARWDRVEALIAATPEDDHDAQWSVVSVCPCCCGPARVEALLCTHCEGADLEALNKAPPCSICGTSADRLDETGTEWRCKPHAGERSS